MGLTTFKLSPALTPPVNKDRKRNKVRHKTLLAHIECCNGNYRILDLTNNASEFPRVIVNEITDDFEEVVRVVKNYLLKKRYTKMTISYITSSGMQFIDVDTYLN